MSGAGVPSPHAVSLSEPLNPAGQDIPTRADPSKLIHFSPEEIAAHFVVFVADLAEQMCDVISYVSVYVSSQPMLVVNINPPARDADPC